MKKLLLLSSLLAACGSVNSPDKPGGGDDDDAPPVGVGGTVHGMWDGADGVVLTLTIGGATTTQTITANGAFAFSTEVADGASYVVAISAQPTAHTCEILAGANGVVADGHATVDVACTGPTVAITLPELKSFAFDPTLETQATFPVSVLTQQVAVKVADDSHVITEVSIGGAELALGATSEPQALPLGASTIEVAVQAAGGLHKTYQLAFDRGAATVAQSVYAKASNTDGGDSFGSRVAASGDTIVVTATGEHSSATGVNGDQDDDSTNRAGAAYVFRRVNGVWAQEAYLKASNTQELDSFGSAVAISGDTIAIAANGEDSADRRINGNQFDNTASNAGAVYVFHRTGTTWTQQAYIKSANLDGADSFGSSVSLDGDLLAVGAFVEASAATGVNGNGADNSAQFAGAAYVFHRVGQTWTQEAYIKASNTDANDFFGGSVAISGSALAVGARGEGSNAKGINGNQADNSAGNAGAVYVFRRTGTAWAQEAYIKGSNTEAGDSFGSSVALSGNTLAASAPQEASSAVGIDGNQANNDAANSGAVYMFVHDAAGWHQQAYIKASNSRQGRQFGSVALSGDVLAVGTLSESSAATGINGDQNDQSASSSGAAYLFRRSGTTWAQTAYIKASNAQANDLFGPAIALSRDTLVVGASAEASGATGINGNQSADSILTMNAGAAYIFR